MKARIRILLITTTVVLVGGVALVAAALNPPGTRSWLFLCAIAATAMAVEAASSEPRDLIPALMLALVPVAGLASKGSPHWLGPPFAALLLIAGELSALGWEGPVRMSADGSLFARLKETALLAVLGVALALLLAVIARAGLPADTWTVVVGAIGLAGVASIAFPRATQGPEA